MTDYLVYPTTSVGSAANEVLVKEDVSDLISNLFPLDTPLQQILSRRPMNNVFSEQPIDTHTLITRTSAALAAADGGTSDLQRPEGETPATTTPQYPARLKMVAEIQNKAFGVSDTARALSMYGIGDRFAYEALKTTQAVVNNFEHAFWWGVGSPPQGFDVEAGGGVTALRATQGLATWILVSGLQRDGNGGTITEATHTDGHGNNYGTGSTALNSGAATHAYNANGLVLDRTMLKEKVFAKWWSLTGRTGGAVGFTGPKGKSLLSEFALTSNGQINERTLPAAAKMIVDTVDWYETDFGVMSVNLSRYLDLAGQSFTINLTNLTDPAVAADEAMFFIHPRYWHIGVVRGVSFASLGKTGDHERGIIRGEMALGTTNPQGGTGCVNFVP